VTSTISADYFLIYLAEFLGLMAVFSVIIVAPGADFALVISQCVVHGRKTALITSFGIGVSLLFHISYTILGIGLIVSKSLLMFSLLKWAGAAYLIWLGIKSWREPAYELKETQADIAGGSLSAPKAFAMGFITNALNPKPVLFFLSLFSALVSPHTPALVQFSYGLGMAAALIIWFVAVSYFFTSKPVREQFLKYSRAFNRVTGALFIGLGLRLAIDQAKVG
jgi:RhtB (resistance to homoserine/threonine) family protein